MKADLASKACAKFYFYIRKEHIRNCTLSRWVEHLFDNGRAVSNCNDRKKRKCFFLYAVWSEFLFNELNETRKSGHINVALLAFQYKIVVATFESTNRSHHEIFSNSKLKTKTSHFHTSTRPTNSHSGNQITIPKRF